MKRALKKIIPAPLWKRLSMFRKRFMLEYRIDGRGERLDMSLRRLPPFEAMSVYERSHFRRYEFACQFVKKGDLCGDFACGTGYGTAMLADKGKGALGIDIDKRVVRDVRKRYADRANVAFRHQDLLDLSLREELDAVVSFETIEHFHEKDIPKLFANFSRALRPGGLFIFSTPYRQQADEKALEAGFHLTFGIDEAKICAWLEDAGFSNAEFFYQNYDTHKIERALDKKDFVVGKAFKKAGAHSATIQP